MGNKINIDVLTLDSVQCAACGYMMEAIAALPKDIQEMIEYTEWSIKNKEGIGKFLELKGRVLPTITIQGDLVFESKIPQYEELVDAPQKTVTELLEHFGFTPGLETRRQLDDLENGPPVNKSHSIELAHVGLDPGRVAEFYAEVFERFGYEE